MAADHTGWGCQHGVLTDAFLIQLKALLDGLSRDADLDDLDASERGLGEIALRNFQSLGAGALAEVTPYLWQYYRSEAEGFTAEERAAYGIPDLDDSTANIWNEVTFRHSPTVELGGNPLEPAPSYVSFEADVSWEPEHGLQVVFEEGLRLCTVGPCDGHSTNAHAYGDPSLLGVIFK
jgi:hypothetical protein